MEFMKHGNLNVMAFTSFIPTVILILLPRVAILPSGSQINQAILTVIFTALLIVLEKLLENHLQKIHGEITGLSMA